jgi:hypothetical protein
MILASKEEFLLDQLLLLIPKKTSHHRPVSLLAPQELPPEDVVLVSVKSGESDQIQPLVQSRLIG